MGEQQLAAVAGAALELLAPAEPVEVAGGGCSGLRWVVRRTPSTSSTGSSPSPARSWIEPRGASRQASPRVELAAGVVPRNRLGEVDSVQPEAFLCRLPEARLNILGVDLIEFGEQHHWRILYAFQEFVPHLRTSFSVLDLRFVFSVSSVQLLQRHWTQITPRS